MIAESTPERPRGRVPEGDPAPFETGGDPRTVARDGQCGDPGADGGGVLEDEPGPIRREVAEGDRAIAESDGQSLAVGQVGEPGRRAAVEPGGGPPVLRVPERDTRREARGGDGLAVGGEGEGTEVGARRLECRPPFPGRDMPGDHPPPLRFARDDRRAVGRERDDRDLETDALQRCPLLGCLSREVPGRHHGRIGAEAIGGRPRPAGEGLAVVREGERLRAVLGDGESRDLPPRGDLDEQGTLVVTRGEGREVGAECGGSKARRELRLGQRSAIGDVPGPGRPVGVDRADAEAVAGEGDPADPVGGRPDRPPVCGGGRVPELEVPGEVAHSLLRPATAATGRDEHAVGREGHGVDPPPGMDWQGSPGATPGEVPELGRAIVARRGERPPVGREGHVRDRLGVGVRDDPHPRLGPIDERRGSQEGDKTCRESPAGLATRDPSHRELLPAPTSL